MDPVLEASKVLDSALWTVVFRGSDEGLQPIRSFGQAQEGFLSFFACPPVIPATVVTRWCDYHISAVAL